MWYVCRFSKFEIKQNNMSTEVIDFFPSIWNPKKEGVFNIVWGIDDVMIRIGVY